MRQSLRKFLAMKWKIYIFFSFKTCFAAGFGKTWDHKVYWVWCHMALYIIIETQEETDCHGNHQSQSGNLIATLFVPASSLSKYQVLS